MYICVRVCECSCVCVCACVCVCVCSSCPKKVSKKISTNVECILMKYKYIIENEQITASFLNFEPSKCLFYLSRLLTLSFKVSQYSVVFKVINNSNKHQTNSSHDYASLPNNFLLENF